MRARGRTQSVETDVVQQLVDAARDGDPQALAEIFDRYHGPVYRYAIARLGSPVDAEDVVAETFLSALGALPRFSWRGVPFEAWLFRIVASKVIDVTRRRQRTALQLGNAKLQVVDQSADPGARLDLAEQQQELAAALDLLPSAQRDVLVLRFLLGHSVEEVATAIRRSEGAVKQLQARALATLRKRVER